MPPLARMLTHPGLRRRFFGALAKSLLLNALISAAILIPGIALSRSDPLLGMIWIFVGSFALMARTYARPWRILGLTCVLPAVTAAGAFAAQLWLCGEATPPPLALGIAALLGLAVGWPRAAAHELYVEQGSVMARRTLGYLVVWAGAYLLAQVLRVVGVSTLLVRGGVLASAFSAAMLITVWLILLARSRGLRPESA